ncbi:MAG: hypothetical protein J1F63_04065 [Oscillospiraceae bacterium]|nr:hypothetical protein [Oscillospiraceae bacterium]
MFLPVPYMPEARVTLAVSGFNIPGTEIIPPPELSALPKALRRHADLGLCPIGGNEVVCPPDSWEYYNRVLTPHGFSVILGGQALGSSYPADSAYNVVVAGKFALLNPKVCDKTLLKLLENRYEIVAVSQGYTKCSVAPVTENALITADADIYKKTSALGMDVLLISNKGVMLPPYENGFFGGATGMTDKKTLAVNGSLSLMESGNDILQFLEAHCVSVMETSSFSPFDTGSLIPLKVIADNN